MGVNVTFYAVSGESARNTTLPNSVLATESYNFPVDLPNGTIRVAQRTVTNPSNVQYLQFSNTGWSLVYVVTITGFTYKDNNIIEFSYALDLFHTYFANYKTSFGGSLAMCLRTTDANYRNIATPNIVPLSNRLYTNWGSGGMVGGNGGSGAEYTIVLVLTGQGAFQRYDFDMPMSIYVMNQYSYLSLCNALRTDEHASEYIGQIDKCYMLGGDVTFWANGHATEQNLVINGGTSTSGISIGTGYVIGSASTDANAYINLTPTMATGVSLSVDGDGRAYETLKPPYRTWKFYIPFVGWVSGDDWANHKLSQQGVQSLALNVRYEIDWFSGRVRAVFADTNQRTEWGELPRLPLPVTEYGYQSAMAKIGMNSSVYDVSKEIVSNVSSLGFNAMTGNFGGVVESGIRGLDLAHNMNAMSQRYDLAMTQASNSTRYTDAPSVAYDKHFHWQYTQNIERVNYESYGDVVGYDCNIPMISVEKVLNAKYWVDCSTALLPDIFGMGDTLRHEIEKDYIIW